MGSDREERPDLLLRALDALTGAVIVLDPHLRVVSATRTAARELGAPIAERTHAVKVLCPEDPGGPLAQALARGVACTTVLRRVTAGGADRMLRARVSPLRTHEKVAGWVVRLRREALPPAMPDRMGEALWTTDPVMRGLFSVAHAVAPTPLDVLIEGEEGTGKASLARAIHAASPRGDIPLTTLSGESVEPARLCALFEDRPRTDPAPALFLDDLPALPSASQAYLLRALERAPSRGAPYDGSTPRVYASSRTPVARAVASGQLRRDLAIRVGAVRLALPPLRARAGDVRLLTDKLIEELNFQGGRRIDAIDDAVRARLEDYRWPGNVRELRVALEAAHALASEPRIRLRDLPPDIADPLFELETIPIHPSAPGRGELDEASKIRRALAQAGGDRQRAAAMLGMSRSTLWRRMREHHIETGEAP